MQDKIVQVLASAAARGMDRCIEVSMDMDLNDLAHARANLHRIDSGLLRNRMQIAIARAELAKAPQVPRPGLEQALYDLIAAHGKKAVREALVVLRERESLKALAAGDAA